MTIASSPTKPTDTQQTFIQELAEILPQQGEWSIADVTVHVDAALDTN
jgi:hypothetical protein